VLDVLEGAEDGPQLAQEASVVVAVVVADDGLDGLGGLVSLVEGDLREEVVNNVLLNDTVEEVLSDEAKLTVDSGESSLDVGPALSGVVRELGVVVVEVGNGN
jgi:hypothetical protein